MPTRIVLDQSPAPSRLSSPRSSNSNNNHHNARGFFAAPSKWVEEEEKQEETKQANNNILGGEDDDDGSSALSIVAEQHLAGDQQQQPKQRNNNKISRRLRRRVGQRLHSFSSSEDDDDDDNMANEHSVGSTPRTPGNKSNNCSRRATSMSGFKSSILRELSVRQDHHNTTARQAGGDQKQQQQQNRDDHDHDGSLAAQQAEPIPRLSSDDIRASSRFLGYLFCMIASAVLLVSVIQFRRRDTTSEDTEADAVLVDIDGQKFFMTANGYLVHRWKLVGAIYVGFVGVISSFLILLAHFDTFCLPRTWMLLFRDGSRGERNLLILLLLFWAAGLHVCTSSLSVGEVQANVYFTTWIAFCSIALNYGVWREAAGLTSLADKVNLHHRETTYNWMWISVFSSIFAGAATDMYFNRTDIELRFQGDVLYLRDSGWVMVLALVWSEVAVCLLAIFLNEWSGEQFSCSIKRKNGRCIFGWRQMEGFVMLLGVSVKVWVILEYTGVDGVINGLSNAYFGIWGSFFNSVFALGTWLRENKNIEYFVKEPRDRESVDAETK